MSEIIKQAKKVLSQYFHFPDFRYPQAEIIQSVLTSPQTLAILPTGAGKSLCYQIPGLLLPGQTLVISPLISLMNDQVEALLKRGIPSTFLSSQLNPTELAKRLRQLSTYKFIYLTPERLVSKAWQDASKKIQISLIAIDEAHCISEWGHDFRPEYHQISFYLERFTTPPKIIALTASATPICQKEICQKLKLTKPKIFSTSIRRTNLFLHANFFSHPVARDIELLRLVSLHQHENGVIYTATRTQAEQCCKTLRHFFPNLKIAFYHAGLANELRTNIQNKFIKNEFSLIVATTAFGMGIDKSNIRFVIHYGIPQSIENYYQEIGRAGRDELPSNCYLLHTKKDWQLAEVLNKKTIGNQRKIKGRKLQQLISLLLSKKCLHYSLVKYFTTEKKNNFPICQNCQNCQPKRNEMPINLQEKINKMILLRKTLAYRAHIAPKKIITDQIIFYLSLLMPQQTTDLRKVPGIGRGFIEKWGNDIILAYDYPKFG